MSIAEITSGVPEAHVFMRCESQVRSYARAFPRIFDRACGTEVWDIHGRRYLDFLAGAGSLNYGHNNPVLKEALLQYILSDSITHSLDMHTAAKEQFLEVMHDSVLTRLGADYVMQFTGPTGANAVEAALKIARKVTGRSNIIFFTHGFHGVSMGALSVTGNQYFRHAAGVALGNGTAMPYEGFFGADVDTIAYLERMLTDPSSGVDEPAAIIVEVIQGEGGLYAASVDWLKRLEALCKKSNIVLIVDDIQAGCGRTGLFFSFEASGIKPDVVTLSKSLSGYGLPLSVVLIKRELDIWKPGEHNGTFRGNNHAFVTAATMLKHYWKTSVFAADVCAKGNHLFRRLQALVERFSPHLVEVRGRGLMQGVCCAKPERAAAIAAKAFDLGLIIERSGPMDEVIKCMMPLTTSESEFDEGLDILERALEDELCMGARTSVSASSHAA